MNDNLAQVQQRLDDIMQKGKNLEPVMAEIANLLLTTTEEAFENEADPFTGAAWEPLAAASLKRKKGKPLYESGHMQDSMNVESNAQQASIGLPAMSKGFPYAAVHQFGSDHVPARPFLPIDASGNISDDLKGDILDLVLEHFEG